MEKIKIKDLSYEDIVVVSSATSKYSEFLQQLCDSGNYSQEYIHFSILTEFRYEILKKLSKREQAKNNTLKMEVHTGFVLYHALQHYTRYANPLEAAILRRIIMELFSLLPFTQDLHSNRTK